MPRAPSCQNPAGGNLVVGSGGSSSRWATTCSPTRRRCGLDPIDLLNVDPLLGPLQDNGGPDLQPWPCCPAARPSTPAIAVGGLTTDQRGVPRPQGLAPDIGAFERTTGPSVRAGARLGHGSRRDVAHDHGNAARREPPAAGGCRGDVPGDHRSRCRDDGHDEPGRWPDRHRRPASASPTTATTASGTDVLIATATPSGGPTVASLGATVLWTTLTVTNTNDSGVGSLRAAIAAANQHPGPDTIDFAPAVTGTIALASPLPDLTTNIDIQGPGANLLTVRRDTGGDYRIFTVASGATVSISGLTISNGQDSGISNAGTLTLSNATIRDNSAGEGGGLYNSGTATVTACTFTATTAIGRAAPCTTSSARSP